MVYRKNLNINEVSVEEFAQIVAMEVAVKLGSDFDVKTETIVKRNDCELHSVIACQKGGDMAPSFYVDEVYDHCFFNNGDINDTARNLAFQFVEYILSLKPSNVPDINTSLSLENENLKMILLDMKLNKKYLEDHPYKEIGAGLALVITVNVGPEYGVVVNNSLMEKYDKEALFKAALENMSKKDQPELSALSSVVDFEYPAENAFCSGKPIREPHVLTIERKSDGAGGAATIAYEGVAEKIAELCEGSYWMLPSSLYEWIIVPHNEGMDYLPQYREMVAEINAAIVDEKDVLSFDVFFYDAEENKIKRM